MFGPGGVCVWGCVWFSWLLLGFWCPQRFLEPDNISQPVDPGGVGGLSVKRILSRPAGAFWAKYLKGSALPADPKIQKNEKYENI